jgi:hypothetical protein
MKVLSSGSNFPTDICYPFIIKVKNLDHIVLLSSQCNDQAPAIIMEICTGAQEESCMDIWRGTPTHPSVQGSSRVEASMEAAHHEEETMAILGSCRRLAEAESQ